MLCRNENCCVFLPRIKRLNAKWNLFLCLDVDDEYEDEEDQWEDGAGDILEKGEEMPTGFDFVLLRWSLVVKAEILNTFCSVSLLLN